MSQNFAPPWKIVSPLDLLEKNPHLESLASQLSLKFVHHHAVTENANACVRNREVDMASLHSGRKDHFSLMGEFDSIAQQISELCRERHNPDHLPKHRKNHY